MAVTQIVRALWSKEIKECLLRYGQKEKRMLLFVCFQRFFLLQLLFFSMGTDGYEPIKRFSADLKSYSVLLKSASIKVGQRQVIWLKYTPDVGYEIYVK